MHNSNNPLRTVVEYRTLPRPRSERDSELLAGGRGHATLPWRKEVFTLVKRG